jgi:hypothetical protein
MFLPPWSIIVLALLGTLFFLFAAFTRWLAHSLEGYPLFLMQYGHRGPGSSDGELGLSGSIFEAATRATAIPGENRAPGE